RDAGGTWGTPAGAPFVVDRTPPSVGSAGATPSPTGGAPTVSGVATAAGATAPLAGAEGFDGPGPGPGAGAPPAAARGARAAAREALTGTLDVHAGALGTHVLQLRARDALGTWSATVPLALVVEAPDRVLADGFESGTLRAFTRAVGRVRASRAARLDG